MAARSISNTKNGSESSDRRNALKILHLLDEIQNGFVSSVVDFFMGRTTNLRMRDVTPESTEEGSSRSVRIPIAIVIKTDHYKPYGFIESWAEKIKETLMKHRGLDLEWPKSIGDENSIEFRMSNGDRNARTEAADNRYMLGKLQEIEEMAGVTLEELSSRGSFSRYKNKLLGVVGTVVAVGAMAVADSRHNDGAALEFIEDIPEKIGAGVKSALGKESSANNNSFRDAAAKPDGEIREVGSAVPAAEIEQQAHMVG